MPRLPTPKTQLPAVSYRHTPLVHLSGEFFPRLPTSKTFTSPSVVSYWLLSWCISWKEPCHGSLHWQRSRPLRPFSIGASRWCTSREGHCNGSLRRTRQRHLQQSTTGESKWYISHTFSLPRLLSFATPTARPVVSYRQMKLVHLPGKPLPRHPTSALPTPPPAVSYRLTPFVHLSGDFL